MIATQTPPAEEWILEHGDRCEFVLGGALEKPMPSLQHSKGQKRLTNRLTQYEEATGMGFLAVECHHRFGPPEDIRVYVPDWHSCWRRDTGTSPNTRIRPRTSSTRRIPTSQDLGGWRAHRRPAPRLRSPAGGPLRVAAP